MLGDPEVMRHYPRTIVEAGPDPWIERQLQRYVHRGHGMWLVELRETSEPVGQVGVSIQETDMGLEPEVGYLIHRPHWRRGYATEAALACRDWALRELRPARVVSLVLPANLPSQAVARKMGMREVGRCKHAGLEHLVFEYRLET